MYFIAIMRAPGSGKYALFYNVATWFQAMQQVDNHINMRSVQAVNIYFNGKLIRGVTK